MRTRMTAEEAIEGKAACDAALIARQDAHQVWRAANRRQAEDADRQHARVRADRADALRRGPR